MSQSPPSDRRWFQFGLTDMLLGTTLVAIGIGVLLATINDQIKFNIKAEDGRTIYFGLIFGSGGMIGAGLLAPLKLKIIGLFVGYSLAFVVLCFVKAVH